MERNCRDLVVENSRDNSLLVTPPINPNLEGFNTSSKLLYGLDEDDSIGLKLDERKRRRGDPKLHGIMDVDGGLQLIGPQITNQNRETGISDGDLSVFSLDQSATLAMQASREP